MFYIQDPSFPREQGIVKPLHSQFWGHLKSFLFSCAFFLYLTLKDWREAPGWCKISAKLSVSCNTIGTTCSFKRKHYYTNVGNLKQFSKLMTESVNPEMYNLILS